jgi:hypothetical protein
MKKLNAVLWAALAVFCVMTISCISGGGRGDGSSVASAGDMEAAEKNDTWFNLQNFHYLEWFYEKDGLLVYGDVSRDSDEALWSFTKASKRKGRLDTYAVRNKASGKYLMPLKGSDKIVVIDSEDPFYWSWEMGRYGIVLGDTKANAFSDPADDRIVCIHMEAKKGYAENSQINKTWGTPNWLLHEHGEVKYWAIKSEDTGMYLYEDENDTLRLGSAADKDSRYYWIYENTNNVISIKNRRTGHTISVQNIYNFDEDNTSSIVEPNLSLPVKVINSLQHWRTNRWDLARVGNRGDVMSIESAYSRLPNFRLYHKPGGDTFVYMSDIVQATSPSAQWRQEEVEASSLVLNVPDYWVRLRNSGIGDYMYELPESRSIVAGKAEAADPRSHWRFVKDNTGYYRLRNRATGNDASLMSNSVRVETAGSAQTGNNALWEMAFAPGNENLVFRNRVDTAFLLNFDKAGEKGYAEASVQSVSAGHTQWMSERAPEAGTAPVPKIIAASLNRATPLAELQSIPVESVFKAADALKRGKTDLIFSVYAPRSGSYPVAIAGAAAGNILVNGADAGAIAASAALNLNAGINTITLRSKDASKINSLTVRGGAGIAKRGATVPWRQYEAEAMRTNAQVISGNRIYRQFTSEASGRAAVRLQKTGDYVEFTAGGALNSLVLRYCLPDAAEGGGIEATLGLYVNGQRVKNLDLTSKYAWVYGTYPWNNTPDNLPHRFFDDTRFLLDSALPEGTVIRLQRDAQDTAEYYIIDLVDIEDVPPPAQMPANALSITSFGAVANDGNDDTAALMKCISAAVKAKKEVWIPEGVFNFNNARSIEITNKGLVIRGAGVWYSVLNGPGAGFLVKVNDVSFYDFSLIGEETGRNDALGRAGFESKYKSRTLNMTVQNIWMEHLKVGVWVYAMEGLLVSGCRIRNTYADGINLCGGSSFNVIEQTAIRNTGDDSIALWSRADHMKNDVGNKIRFNTVGLQWLANNFAVYGGQDNEVTDNIFHDTVAFGAAITISTNHDPVDFKGTVTAKRNTLLRCGGYEYNFNQDFGAIWILPLKNMDVSIVLADNEIIDSTYQGILVHGGLGGRAIREIIVENNYIDTCGTWAIDIGSSTTGKMNLKGNSVSGSMMGVFRNTSGSDFAVQGDL